MALMQAVAVCGLFAGPIRLLPGESRGSAIAKQPLAGPVRIERDGVVGDEHADPRAHGGPEKAVHLFPQEHYAALALAFPDARHLHPGGLGENLSTRGLTEENTCIGDVFALGTVRLQVSQPRTPCWKIDARCGLEGIAAHVAQHGIAGWYFRVLDAGACTASDALIHLERPSAAVTLARFNSTLASHRPALVALERMASAPGLAPEWVQRIHARLQRLRDYGDRG